MTKWKVWNGARFVQVIPRLLTRQWRTTVNGEAITTVSGEPIYPVSE